MDMLRVVLITILVFIIVCLFVRIAYLKKRLAETDRIKKELYSLGEEMTTVESMEEASELILDSALRIINKVDKGSILIEDKDGLFKYSAIRGYPKELKKITLTKEEMYLNNYNKFKNTAIINKPYEFDKLNLRKDRYNHMVSSGGIGSIYSVLSSPIKIKGRLIGVINIDSMKKSVVFNQEDIRTMEHIKNELELTIRNFFSQEEYKYTSTHDELTGLYNRRTLRPFIERELIKVRERGISSYFLILDMDGFKGINDTYGHDIGDLSLIRLASSLKMGSGKDAICIRLSGDEFVVIFSNTSEIEVKAKMKWLKEELEKEIDDLPALRFSYGMSVIENMGENTYEEIFRIADKNMYHNKNMKKNRLYIIN
ncbi:diguanylate cyclase [Alloiococcus sp. CFN-8]|uniref:sensor domain-containing diguanylate cyclase n=1 Tax=Alloiococcus sp. CFN-8 TaxID=3416081 RepID=UPI003CE67740